MWEVLVGRKLGLFCSTIQIHVFNVSTYMINSLHRLNSVQLFWSNLCHQKKASNHASQLFASLTLAILGPQTCLRQPLISRNIVCLESEILRFLGNLQHDNSAWRYIYTHMVWKDNSFNYDYFKGIYIETFIQIHNVTILGLILLSFSNLSSNVCDVLGWDLYDLAQMATKNILSQVSGRVCLENSHPGV